MVNEERGHKKSSRVSIGNWIWTLILSVIPIVNIIFYIVCICVSKKASKRNWAIANIILIVASLLIVLLTVVFFGKQIADAVGNIKLEDLTKFIPQ